MKNNIRRYIQNGFVKYCLVLGCVTGYAMAKEGSPDHGQPLKDAPNVVLVLLDDVGFGASSTFGGPVETPTLDTLAEQGLKYNRFHTTAICSPTRASLLTGRNPHTANVGAVLNSSNSYPGWQGILSKETASVAQILRQNGYSTAIFGKWHLTPPWESTPIGPFDRWPVGLGFEKFYGFLGGETDQFEPTLVDGTTLVHRPEGDDYHLTEDLAEQAMSWIQLQKTVAPEKPFFVYFAPGAAHAPLQVHRPWIDRYKGQFSQGWDALREEIFQRQKALGVIPDTTALTARHAELPAWDSLSSDEQKVAQRLMETYAGFLTHTDVQVGRLVDKLKTMDQFDNTLFIYIVGDNGGSSEGGLTGSVNYMGQIQGMPEPLSQKLARLEDIGGPDTFPHIPSAWAWATNTPFPWVKQVASHLGGTRNAAVISWPRQISDQGELRSQFTHVVDVAPTILEAAGVSMPEQVDGVTQLPLDGASLLPSFKSATAPEHRSTQLFEVHGHRGIYHDGWLASALHSTLPWSVGRPAQKTDFDDDTWELYDLEQDFSQSRDLAETKPEKLQELKQKFNEEAGRMGILPLQNALVAMREAPLPQYQNDRTAFTFHEGAVGIPEKMAPRIFNRSWRLRAVIEQTDANAPPQGVIATMGGRVAGWSLYLDESSRPVFEYRAFEAERLRIVGDEPWNSGQPELTVDFAYDGGGYGKGGVFTLRSAQNELGRHRVEITPPAVFSIDETFDVGMDTGSPAGRYPADAPLGYPFMNGGIKKVEVELN